MSTARRLFLPPDAEHLAEGMSVLSQTVYPVQFHMINNVCEGWNHAFTNMVGHHHPSLWIVLGMLQQDQALVATALLQDARCQPPAKRVKRAVDQQQQRLHKLCCDRPDSMNCVEATLCALGHCMPEKRARMKWLAEELTFLQHHFQSLLGPTKLNKL